MVRIPGDYVGYLGQKTCLISTDVPLLKRSGVDREVGTKHMGRERERTGEDDRGG
jgi:hypothetical protein